ncbi:hypothetical protein [uncultured Treponema sp.]|uniref:hypothetical protein n=1 Tax=Treponema sp. TaxID=166 RepID=UPI0015AF5D5B|nr:hypothetical protein [uncultured Treponema sp.]
MKLEKLAAYGSTQAVLQNLKDAGCTKEMTQQIIMKLEKNDFEELSKLLEQHRSCLLNLIHDKEKQIDCLDYLVYQIKRNKEK